MGLYLSGATIGFRCEGLPWIGCGPANIATQTALQPESNFRFRCYRSPYREVLPLLNAGRCSILDLPRLASQLIGLERRTARGGKDSIDHAPAAHDDVANAAAGALLLASTVRVGMKINPAALALI